MPDELIPQDSAQVILQQVFNGMHEALENQVALSEQQLVQMMLSYLERELTKYADTVAEKLDKFTPNNE